MNKVARNRLVACVLVVLILCVIPGAALAASWTTGWYKIKQLGDLWSDNGILIQLEIPTQDPNVCSGDPNDPADNYVIKEESDNSYREKAALIMAAYLGRKEVSLVFANDTCVNGWPKVLMVKVREPQ